MPVSQCLSVSVLSLSCVLYDASVSVFLYCPFLIAPSVLASVYIKI
jgi:hypothetical protein